MCDIGVCCNFPGENLHEARLVGVALRVLGGDSCSFRSSFPSSVLQPGGAERKGWLDGPRPSGEPP